MSAGTPLSDTRRTLAASVLGCSPFVGLAIWHVWVPYSLWFDELYSVTASGGPWRALTSAVVRLDLQPPLYAVVLKLWMAVVGHGEVQARSLSLLCALAAFAVLCAAVRDRGRPMALATLLFFTTCWLFAYYAQEVRNYAMLLLAATIATILDGRRADRPGIGGHLGWYLALLWLALVHYFGLLYALMLLAGDLWRQRRRAGWRTVISTGLVAAPMLAWPCLQAAAGTLTGPLHGTYWNHVDGLGGTLSTFVRAIVDTPKFQPAGFFFLTRWNVPLTSTVVLVGATLGALLLARGPSRRALRRLTTLLVGFVGIVALIDKVAPVSIDRNYVVLLPATALLFGHVVDALWTASGRRWQRGLVVLFVGAFSAKSGLRAVGAMESRWTPTQNWKALAATLDSSGACRTGCWAASPGNVAAYYFAPAGEAPSAFNLVAWTELLTDPPADGRPIAVGNTSPEPVEQVRRLYPHWACLEPPQEWRGTVVFLTPSSDVPSGLMPCAPTSTAARPPND